MRRLAERGQVFTNALASFHQTTMSMASLFTGRTPSLETRSRTEPLPWNGHTWCGLSRLAVSEEDTCVPQAAHDRFFLYVHYMDAALGALLDHLEAEGLLENALVVFTSDHGEMLTSDEAIRRRPSHYGNPSFEPVLQVPMIVAPPTSSDSASYLRTQDLRGLLMSWIGRPAPQDQQDLAADELLLTEAYWQTYRRWPWKSIWKRGRKRGSDGPWRRPGVPSACPSKARAFRVGPPWGSFAIEAGESQRWDARPLRRTRPLAGPQRKT